LSDTRVLVSRYEIRALLGRGGMGEVYLARDRLLDRDVAIKVLASRFAHDGTFVERFRREAQAAATLNHPNLVNVHDTGTDQGLQFIVMELVRGKTLSRIVEEESPLLPRRAAEIAASVAGALTAAHAGRIVHGDVKPGNVLVTSEGGVKVTDFGIARAANPDPTETPTIPFGTPAYSSPEQAQGLTLDGRSDIYSLGCVLYELLTGRPPFQGSPPDIARKHIHDRPAPPRRLNPDVPRDLERIVLTCLEKAPGDRYANARALEADLRTFLVEDQAPPARKRAAGWLLAGPFLLLAIVLLAAALILPVTRGTEVPYVRGEPLSRARQILGREGFETEVDAYQESLRFEAGIVLDYQPTRARPGATILLTVSSGAPERPVPDVVCVSRMKAQVTLRNAGFRVITAGERQNNACPEDGGLVSAQDPAARQLAPVGSTVRIFLLPVPEAFPDEQEAVLLSHIPGAIRPLCVRAESGPLSADAMVRCDTGVITVQYNMFASTGVMETYYARRVNDSSISAGDCSADSFAEGPYYIQGEVAGRVLCYLKEEQRESWIEWTNVGLRIYAYALRRDLDDTALYDWWAAEAGPV
jgi:hypothetical protein